MNTEAALHIDLPMNALLGLAVNTVPRSMMEGWLGLEDRLGLTTGSSG